MKERESCRLALMSFDLLWAESGQAWDRHPSERRDFLQAWPGRMGEVWCCGAVGLCVFHAGFPRSRGTTKRWGPFASPLRAIDAMTSHPRRDIRCSRRQSSGSASYAVRAPSIAQGTTNLLKEVGSKSPRGVTNVRLLLVQVLRQLDEDKSHREQDMEKLKAEVYSQQALLQAVPVGRDASVHLPYGPMHDTPPGPSQAGHTASWG